MNIKCIKKIPHYRYNIPHTLFFLIPSMGVRGMPVGGLGGSFLGSRGGSSGDPPVWGGSEGGGPGPPPKMAKK